MLGDPDSLALDQIREAEEQPTVIEHTPAKRGRKRKIVEDLVCTFFFNIKVNFKYIYILE